MNIDNIAYFLAHEWFREASRSARDGIFTPYTLMTKPNDGNGPYHPIVTLDPTEYPAPWQAIATITPNHTIESASSLIRSKLFSANIL